MYPDAFRRKTATRVHHVPREIHRRCTTSPGNPPPHWRDVIHRTGRLFLGSDKGGQTAAVLFSFTATCKHLRIDTFAYLRDMFERLPTHPADRLDELLPHRWQLARQATASTPNALAPSDAHVP